MERSVAGIWIVEGRVFVARRGASGSQEGRWEFPGGKVEGGETDQEAVAREFKEEFEIAASVRELVGTASFTHKGRERELAAWLIEVEKGATPQLLEHTETSWALPEELDGLDFVESDRKLLPFVLPLLGS